MNFSRIINGLSIAVLCMAVIGCSDLGEQLASVLPENGGPSIGNGQLNESGDSDAIDASQIGGGGSSMAQPAATDAGGSHGMMDGQMDEDYAEMMLDVSEDTGIEGDFGEGSHMDLSQSTQMMQLDNPNDGFEDSGMDPDMTAQMEMLAPAISEGDEETPGYLESMGGADMLASQPDNLGSGQLTGGISGGAGTMQKPTNRRGPQKQKPTNSGLTNILDRPNKPSTAKPSKTPSKPQAPSSPPNSQETDGKPNTPVREFRMPGKVVNPIYRLVNNVAVPILLQNGTAMSFSSEIQQQRDLASQGTVYWVVHSQRLGFIRFKISPGGGRVSGVGSKFTPTSGPFKAFVATIEADGEIKYLSSPVDMQWNG